MGNAADSLHNRSAIVAPKPSPRLKLRASTLLPSLPVGDTANGLYVAYRSRALQLGAARNELTLSAGAVVRERAKVIEQVVRARDGAWSDDPADHSARGRVCGNGLGIILGIARRDVSREQRELKPDERTEAALDLHGIHAAEATEILEGFLLGVCVIQHSVLAY